MHWLLPIVGIGLALQASGQLLNVQFQSNGLEKSGVTMIPFGAPGFQSWLTNLVQPASAVGAEGLYPYSFVLTNTTKKTILMYSVQWEYDGRLGNRANLTSNTWNLSGMYDASSDDLAPGASCIVTPIMRLGRLPGPNAQAVASGVNRFLPLFSKSSSVIVKLQSVLWDDYSSNGPDAAGAVGHALAYLTSERDLMKEIVAVGNTQALTNMLAQEAAPPGSRMGPRAGDSYAVAYAIFKGVRARSFSGVAASSPANLVKMAQTALKTKSYPTTPTP